jgi:histidyl-tRNA synthetase
VTPEFSAPKGVPEYLPPASRLFRAVRAALAQPAQCAGYGYIELPVFEDTALFERGVGESTDVVSKEMYTFEDRGGRSISLRPEGTAGVMRSVVQHGLHRGALPIKLWYEGPFFRAERPQRGRYRQLQQVGLEAIGSEDPALDAEVITIADDAFRGVGLRQYTLQLTSLGCRDCRPAYAELLVKFLATCDLDEATRTRAHVNPLRVLDDKRPEVQQQLENAPLPSEHLCGDCTDHYAQVREFLQRANVHWVEAPRLVRGLDYYTRTAFEFTHSGLGAQSGIGGGGRYDGLMESVGGPGMSGIGFGLGVDRTLLAVEAEGIDLSLAPSVQVFAIPMDEDSRGSIFSLVAGLRRAGISAEMAFDGKGIKAAMKAADRSGARWAIIMGQAERDRGDIVLKNLLTGEQQHVPSDTALEILSKDVAQ